MDYSCFAPPAAPSADQTAISSNPACTVAMDFFSTAAITALYPSISGYAKDAERDATYYGRMYKAYSAVHSAVFNGGTNTEAVLANLDEKYSLILDPSKGKVPKVPFGKTGIMMPVLTLGCMRFQETWNGAKFTDVKDIDAACQANLKAILVHALERGVNHIETARGYGASELQLGQVSTRAKRARRRRRRCFCRRRFAGAALLRQKRARERAGGGASAKITRCRC